MKTLEIGISELGDPETLQKQLINTLYDAFEDANKDQTIYGPVVIELWGVSIHFSPYPDPQCDGERYIYVEFPDEAIGIVLTPAPISSGSG